MTGQTIADVILEEVQKSGLDMANCRGQAYDGAANMSGAVKGAASIISKKYPKAVYQHCKSHQLNLSILKASKSIPEISK